MRSELTPSRGTLSVWGGEEEYLMQHATQVPVVHSVSFGYRNVDEWLDVALGRKKGHIYSRNTNPTVAVLEEKVRILEGAEAATSAGPVPRLSLLTMYEPPPWGYALIVWR